MIGLIQFFSDQFGENEAQNVVIEHCLPSRRGSAVYIVVNEIVDDFLDYEAATLKIEQGMATACQIIGFDANKY